MSPVEGVGYFCYALYRDRAALIQAAAGVSRVADAQLFSDQRPLSSRDLRAIIPLTHGSSAAAILLRRGALLVAFPPMRGVLTATRCFVLLEQVRWGFANK